MGTGTSGNGRKYQARIGERTVDLVLDGDTVLIDGEVSRFSREILSDQHVSLIIDGHSVPAVVLPDGGGRYRVHVKGQEFGVDLKDERDLLLERFGLAEAAGVGLQEIRAPMPGLVLSIAVGPGDEVAQGAALAVLEAMKMENELRAERDGVVKAVHVSAGDAVGKNELLLEIE